MKKIIALLLVIGLFGCFGFAGDAPRPERKRPEAVSRTRHVRPDAFRGINLTDEQKAKIETIKKETGEKIKALIEESRVAIKAVLTDEQVAELDARQEEMKKRHGERKPTDKPAPQTPKRG
jgi:Spy/CpxP family protein refolding chaperone